MNKENTELNKQGIANFDNLKVYLNERLRNAGKQRVIDQYGNVCYTTAEIFSDTTLSSFIHLSLSDFNQVPGFTDFTFNDTDMIERFAAVLVDGAVLYCLSSQALIERGREYIITDDGVLLYPPSIADMMMTQYQSLIPTYWEKIKLIKAQYL